MISLENLDLDGHQLKNAVVDNLASAPINPVAGQIYYDTLENKFKYYNGSEWVESGSGGSSGSSGGTEDWEEITYTRTNDNTIVVTNTNNKFKTGMPIKFTISSVAYYAIITGVSTNVLTLAGAPFTSSVTKCYLGKPDKVMYDIIPFNEYYSAYPKTSNNIDDLILTHNGSKWVWGHSNAKCVRFGAFNTAIDNPASSINVYKGSKILFALSNLSMDAANTWAYTTSMDTNNYSVVFGNVIDVRINRTATDANALARNLTLAIWWVLE